MKSFNRSKKHKTPGISLLIAVICSTIGLIIVITILTTVSRSIEQSQNLERSTQVFFAIESGLEAGFFHHNARGQGVSFLEIDEEEFDEAQKINHSATTLDTLWTIDGRSDSNEIEGLIYEDTPLQLRWYWDDSGGVSEPITPVHKAPNFTFSVKSPSTLIDFGDKNSGVVLSWMITKKTNNGTSSLIPRAENPEDPCKNSLFICRDETNSIASILKSFDGESLNTLLPRTFTDTTTTIKDFLINGDDTEFQLILTPVRPFTDSIDNTKIEGIPFTFIENAASSLPRPEYSIHTRIETNNFSKDLILENIPEQTAIQAFSYAIFD